MKLEDAMGADVTAEAGLEYQNYGAAGRDSFFSAMSPEHGVGIVTAIRKEGVDPVAGHAEQRRKAVPIMRLSRRQNEARRTSLGIASGVKPGGEAAARPAKRLGFLKSLVMPTAQ